MHFDVAAHRASIAHGRRAHQVPRAGLEPVLAASKRTNRAQLDRVARKDGVVGLARERANLALATPLDGCQRFVPGDLLVEASAAIAHDASLAVEDDAVGQRVGLLLVPLLLREP